MQTGLPQTIKDKLSIVDVLASYIKLENSGKNYKARCPFHNERTASFYVSPERQSYYCFGCNAKGDIFSFVEQFEGIDFKGALKILAERAGVPLVFSKENKPQDDLYDIMEAATSFFEHTLRTNTQAQEYLKKRGVTEQSIKAFRIGYAPDDWRQLNTYLTQKGYTNQKQELVGLVKKSDKKGENTVYDRFRDRIMFPLTDSSGRTIAFSGRILNPSETAPKYMNSPDTPLFDKSKVLFGIDKAKQAIHRAQHVIVVEGQMDVVMSHQAGITNTVGISGTALSEEISDEKTVTNLGLVKRLTSNIKFALDTDKAGIQATLRSAQIALSLGMDVKISVMDGKDPADTIAEDPEKYKEALKKSMPLIEYLIWSCKKNNTDPKAQKKALRLSVIPYLHAIQSPIERAQQAHVVAQELGVSDDAVLEEVRGYKPHPQDTKTKQQDTKISTAAIDVYDQLLRRLFGFLIQTKPEWQEFKPLIDQTVHSVLKEQYKTYLDTFTGLQNDILFELDVVYGNSKVQDIKADIEEMTKRLHADYTKRRMSLLVQALSIAEKNKDEDKIASLMAEVGLLMKQLPAIDSKDTSGL